jgi:methyl-accepting chemotaxis protein
MSIFSFLNSNSNNDAIAAAINRSMAMIEMSIDGEILSFNENFQKTVGYSLDEVKGKHHSTFVDLQYQQSPDYRMFWDKLKRGEFDRGQYKRVAKGGKIIWLEASYNPILDARGKPIKIVKFATDITEQKIRGTDLAGQVDAISKSQAVIEFTLDGVVLNANQNFLSTLGYDLHEIKDRHHSMFVDPQERQSEDYRQFWERLKRGDFFAGQFRRIGKGGREIFIQASYNPIFDPEGRPYKVVKFAADVTEQVKASRIEKVVREILAVVDAAKDKDLTARVATDEGTADVRKLCTGVNDLLDTLASLIEAVRVAAQESVTASTAINEGSRDLATRTEQQAASLEETAATTEELAASVKNTAQSSRQVTVDAEEARSVAEEGGRAVGEAVDAMTRIESASSKISEITSVIEEIAFQTNLLALNAAVEAARAGDAGKGFAVVAAEVRTLAQRSSQAAKDIGGLISSSTTEVSQGVRLVRDAGSTLGRIVQAAGRVAGTVTEISTAAAEQAHGIDEMSQTVAHMDEMTQQNAALAEETSASAESLYRQIGDLNALVGEYRTGQSAAAGSPLPRRAGEGSAAPNEPARLRQLAAGAMKRGAPAKASAKAEPARAAGGGRWGEF